MEKRYYTEGYYEGELNASGMPDGNGTFVWNDGESYAGEWRNGKRNGRNCEASLPLRWARRSLSPPRKFAASSIR